MPVTHKVRIGSIVLFSSYPNKIKIKIQRILNSDRIEGVCVGYSRVHGKTSDFIIGQLVNGYMTDIISVLQY